MLRLGIVRAGGEREAASPDADAGFFVSGNCVCASHWTVYARPNWDVYPRDWSYSTARWMYLRRNKDNELLYLQIFAMDLFLVDTVRLIY